MTENQTNKQRLLTDFRFAAPGARCRSATFIDPALPTLSQCEWMEAECENGRTWALKILRAAPGPGGELLVRQTYLETDGDLNFGAAVVRLHDYEQAQKALGYLPDSTDTGAQAGALPYNELASRHGIVFTTDGAPVASKCGLITVPGTYPIAAFKQAAQKEQDISQDDSLLSSIPNTSLAPVHNEKQDKVLTRGSVFMRNAIFDAEKNSKKLLNVDLDGGFFVLVVQGGAPVYAAFERKFTAELADIKRQIQSAGPLPDFEQTLEQFNFNFFRFLGQCAQTQLLSNHGELVRIGKCEKALADMYGHCQASAAKLQKNLTVGGRQLFSLPLTYDENHKIVAASLRSLVEQFERDSNLPQIPFNSPPQLSSSEITNRPPALPLLRPL